MESGRCCPSCSSWRLQADCQHQWKSSPHYHSSSTHWYEIKQRTHNHNQLITGHHDLVMIIVSFGIFIYRFWLTSNMTHTKFHNTKNELLPNKANHLFTLNNTVVKGLGIQAFYWQCLRLVQGYTWQFRMFLKNLPVMLMPVKCSDLIWSIWQDKAKPKTGLSEYNV